MPDIWQEIDMNKYILMGFLLALGACEEPSGDAQVPMTYTHVQSSDAERAGCGEDGFNDTGYWAAANGSDLEFGDTGSFGDWEEVEDGGVLADQ